MASYAVNFFAILAHLQYKCTIQDEPVTRFLAMKELQAGIQLVRTKCIQLHRHPVFKKRVLKPVSGEALPQQRHDCPNGTDKGDCPKGTSIADRQKPILSFPVSSPLEGLRQRTTQRLRRLKHQAEHINQLSAELEVAVLEFKAIASEVNRDWKAIQAMQEPTSASSDICKYQTVHLPIVQQKSSGSFVLTSRTMDLFQAEREAELLAQTLRRRAKRKRQKR